MSVVNQNQIFKQYISRLQIDFILVDHGLCPDWCRPPHRRKRDTLYLILEGEGRIEINGETLYPKPNDLVLLPQNSMISLYAQPETCYNKYWCDFSMLVDKVPLFDILEAPRIIHLADISYAKSLFEQLESYRSKNDIHSALQINAILLELVSLIFQDDRGCIKHSFTKDSFVTKIEEYVISHLSDSLSVSSLASLMGFHEKYFNEVFKQHFATTPAQYIKSMRLEQAKRDLLYTDDSISCIAEHLGYSSSQKLAKDFRTYTAFTPTAFRKEFK